jgi:hypothetical protein
VIAPSRIAEIEALLRKQDGRSLSDCFIGKYLNVHNRAVQRCRWRLEAAGIIPVVLLRTCMDGTTRNVGRIGSRKAHE